jgi:hypothetical protein
MKCAAIWSNVTAVTFVCLLPFSFAFGQVLSHVDAIDQQLSLASQRNIASSGQLIIDPDTNPVLEHIADGKNGVKDLITGFPFQEGGQRFRLSN